MISWEEYLRSNILHFRAEYETNPKKFKELFNKKKELFLVSLLKPCQIVVIDFLRTYPKCFIVLHSEEFPDMEIEVAEYMTYKDFSSDALKRVRLLKSTSNKGIHRIVSFIKTLLDKMRKSSSHSGGWDYSENFSLCVERFDYRTSKSPNLFSQWQFSYLDLMIDEMSRKEQIEKIEDTVEDLSRDIKAIPEEVELRNRIMETAQRLREEIIPLKKQQKELRDEIIGIKKIVGSETYGEWKVLLSEIDKVNTRVDAFSNIKDAYDKVLTQQTQFMKQQAEVMKQQSSFIKWIKYATILLPIAVISVPLIEIVSILIRHFLGIP